MIYEYENGEALIRENRPFLETNPYMSMFFFLDAPLLQNPDRENYALRVGTGENRLLAMKVVPYSLMLFGSEAEAEALCGWLIEHNYALDSLLGPERLCAATAEVFSRKYDIRYQVSLAMDFMEADCVTEPVCPSVEIPTLQDSEELWECTRNFYADCGLLEQPSYERMVRTIPDTRILREGNRIAAMARITPATENSRKIAFVYTRPEYRGQGLARKLVATVMHEILAQGKIATLNVDQKNPVSNHLYTSLGFRKVFSQAVYALADRT